MRGGRWIQAELCVECAGRRRTTFVPLLTAALSTVALAAGAAYAIDRMTRDGNETPAVNPADWAKRLRGGTPTLSAFSRDLTAAARENLLDPVIGRDDEVERVIAILSRRSKNNPVLVGEPGVGKTAVVEGLAQRIVRGEVPAALRNKRVVALAVGPLVAGTKYRGEFEGRVKRILDEVRRAARDIILFIDELHTLVGAGAAEGSLDLSSLIKPELARGELQCIGATTFEEYRKHIEADSALERRFQPVMVSEPTIEQTSAILRGLRGRYSEHHGVTIDDDAIDAAANLSARYIVDRFLPDKAIDLMDEAAASVALARPHAAARDRRRRLGDRLEVDRHTAGLAHRRTDARPARNWKRRSPSASSARARLSRSSHKRSGAAARDSRIRANRSAVSCSSVRAASGRPNSHAPSPARCSAPTTRSSGSTCPNTPSRTRSRACSAHRPATRATTRPDS